MSAEVIEYAKDHPVATGFAQTVEAVAGFGAARHALVDGEGMALSATIRELRQGLKINLERKLPGLPR